MTTTASDRSLPAEWAPQSGVMLTWPHAQSDWHANLAAVEHVYLDLARVICQREKLLVVCYDSEHQQHIQALLDPHVDLKRVVFSAHPSNDSWARDHGPITILEQQRPRLLDFRFNGWGGKYAHDLDNRISAAVYVDGIFDNTPLDHIDLILEGGSIDSDGEGSLLTTRACLMHPGRNPRLSQSEIEAELKSLLGVKRILWLEHGWLAGDDTDSHIDMLARFCDARTIAYTTCSDPADEQYAELAAMQAELSTLTQVNGDAYTLVALPIPEAIFNQEGQRLPASYANFLILNEAVLVPQYDDPADKIALQRLANCFPEREVIGINCRAVIEQFGSLHCLTMQLPAGVLKED
ncbi:MAG: agmatine deiminase family protein [Thiohalomonadales bacterium]|nr:agmatine deiminase family protein [Thiohalomonadales bacterium]